VSFRYPGTERDVLKDISFVARAGETVAVVGPTGSGKSTLVALIPRIYDPTQGQILFDGTPLTDLDPAVLRGSIGMVPQDSFLFSDTIQANIGLGLPTEGTEVEGPVGSPSSEAVDGSGSPSRDDGIGPPDESPKDPRVEVAARVAQIHEPILAFPEGYSTLLGERGINLSGGQKQRATLARALAREPSVLILDDALSAVDTQTEARILGDLRNVLTGRTSFIISHRVSAVMNADRILVLDEGQIVERGSHEALLARGGVYATLLRRQLLEEELEGVRTPAAS
jgi:ATP-binding cassette subfamily B protein